MVAFGETPSGKGIDIARDFFFAWGLPFLESEYPEYVDRIAAGRFHGSDVLGGDDAISRDHKWGPLFFLFLSAHDFSEVGIVLSERMNAVAPNPYKGHRLEGNGDKSVIVVSVPMFFEKQFDLEQMPRTLEEWPPSLVEHESDLYFVRHGALFRDPLGEFSAWRSALHQYPRRIWMKRMADECNRIWHRGEYNFVQRVSQRSDPLVHRICLGEFMDAVMRLSLLMTGDFTPYWKWLPQEFRKLPGVELLESLLMRLAIAQEIPQQVSLVKEICDIVHTRLLESGLVTGKDSKSDVLPLMNDRNELRGQIFADS